MMHLLHAEGLRFIRNRVNLAVIAAFFTVLSVSAVNSGLAASEYRANPSERISLQEADKQAPAEMHDAPVKNHGGAKPADSITVSLPPLGGLALSIRQLDLIGPELLISSRSRYSDGRNSDQLFNPLLRELGLLDFAGTFALLLPLTVIALSYGLVQEDRERGLWRLVCAQMPDPARLVFTALTVRLFAVLLPAIAASLLMFALDSGATFSAAAHWLIFIAVFSAFWMAISGIFLLLPGSSGAVAIALLGLWLATTFAAPAVLSWLANEQYPMPSRLETIVEIRRIQAQTAKQQGELLSSWYKAHPEITPIKEPPREVAGLPANLELDGKVRPLMHRYDEVRKAHFEFMERWSVISPAMAAILTADRLAGVDAPRYASHIEAVNRFEDQWRAFYMPRIMGQRNEASLENAQAPSFTPLTAAETGSDIILKQSLAAILLLLLLIILRKRFARP